MKPLNPKPLCVIQVSSSDDSDRDTSEIVAMFIRAKNYLEARAYEETGPFEEINHLKKPTI